MYIIYITVLRPDNWNFRFSCNESIIPNLNTIHHTGVVGLVSVTDLFGFIYIWSVYTVVRRSLALELIQPLFQKSKVNITSCGIYMNGNVYFVLNILNLFYFVLMYLTYSGVNFTRKYANVKEA